MKVLHDIVAIKRRKANTIIELVGHKECIGEVIAVGPGKKIKKGKTELLVMMTCKVGDFVMFSPRAGQDDIVNGEEVCFIREADILCILNPEDVKLSENANDNENRECVGEFKFGM